MNKQEILDYLKEKNVWHEVTEHKAVYNMEEVSQIDIPYPEAEAKNLFVRDDKKRNYYLITVKGNKKVNLKKFRKENNTRALSFASEDELKSIMGVISGAVTPFGLLNDKELKVKFFIDKEFAKTGHLIAVHPNDNTATVYLKAEDLIDIIKERYDDKEVIKKDSVIEYVSLYIVNNFNKLHFDGKKQDYYNRIDGIRKTLSNNFSVSMQMAIMLRAKMMVDKLYEKEEYETIDNFIEYLERSREVDDELLYIVYYGLYDGTINNFTFDSDEKEYNSEVFLDLLESDDHLPESLIVSLCKDKQFKKYDKSIVLLVMGWFFKAKMLGNKNNDLTSLDVIQNLFSNDVTNFDSQAHFKDLSPIFKATLADLHITGLTPDLLNQLINNWRS